MEKYRSRSVFKRAFGRFKRRRLGYGPSKYIRNQRIQTRIEYHDIVYCLQGSSLFRFTTGSQQYQDVSQMLADSVTWSSLSQVYQQYKINAVSYEGYCIQDMSTLRSSFSLAAPSMLLSFFPASRSINYATNGTGMDNQLLVCPNITTKQRKYIQFYNNMVPGRGDGGGFGVWSPMNGQATQLGELVVSNSENGNTASASHNLFGVRVVLYVEYQTLAL